MITFKTAREICFCYAQIEEAGKLLEKCKKHIEENGSLSYTEMGSDRISHMQLSIPTSFSGSRILQVDDELAMQMILKQVKDKKERLKILNVLAEREI